MQRSAWDAWQDLTLHDGRMGWLLGETGTRLEITLPEDERNADNGTLPNPVKIVFGSRA